MMSYFTEEGLCVPATVIALEQGNIVTAVKTEETDGYNAVQVRADAELDPCGEVQPSSNRVLHTPSGRV